VVTALFEDADGVLWFGTTAGVTRYDPASWHTWQSPPAPTGRITALAYGDGALWAAGATGQLYRLEQDTWRRVPLRIGRKTIRPTAIEALYLDEQGTLWIGTRDRGLLAYDGRRTRRWTLRDGLAENFITAIARSPDGLLWTGFRSAGLGRWDGRAWRTLTVDDGLLSNEVTALLVDDAGALWVGTRAGLNMFDGQQWRAFTTDDGLPANQITALAQDDEGAIWAATWGGGVSRWQDDVWTTFDGRNGLVSTGVTSLLAVRSGLWIGSDNGMNGFDGRSWQHFSYAYGYDVGRVYALAGDDDILFLGGDQGVTRYRLERTPPRITLFTINGRPPQGEALDVEAGAQVHALLQGGDIHSPPDDLLYLTHLEGVDEGWRQGRQPLISYEPLSPGDYTLLAMVRDPSMNYSQPLRVHLRVRTPQPYIAVPGLGHIHPGFALAGVALMTLLAAGVGYLSWNAALRWRTRQQALERRFNPYIAGSPIRSRDMFFGRDKLLRDLEASLAHNSMMLHGERRIGKTSLLYRLLEELLRLDDPKFRFYPVFVDLEGTPEEEFFHQLMEGLLDALQDHLSDFPAAEKLQYHLLPPQVPYTDRHMRRDLRQIIAHLKKKTRRAPRIIFLLDEADTLSNYNSLTQQQFRRILQDVFARNVGAVISGVYISKTWDRMESPWYNMFVEVIVPPLSREEAEQLMREPVRGVYAWEDDAVEFVWRRTHGRPHRIQQIAREAVNLMLNDGRRQITCADVQRAYERVVFAERVVRRGGKLSS
jgi:Cdc6-like AAA superfamily ATPase